MGIGRVEQGDLNLHGQAAAGAGAARNESPGSVARREIAQYAQAKWPGSV